MRPAPIEEKKKPAGMRIAAVGMPSRATQPAPIRGRARAVPVRRPAVSAASATMAIRLSVTSTPAWAWPAREKPSWKSVTSTAPLTIRVR